MKKIYAVKKLSLIHNELIQEIFSNISNFDFEKVIIVKLAKEEIFLPNKKFIYNLIILKPYFEFDYTLLSKSDFVLNFDIKKHEEIMNKYIEIFSSYDLERLKEILNQITEEVSTLAGYINLIKGNTIDLYSIILATRNNKKIYDYMNYKIDKNKSVSSAEKKLYEITKEFYKEMANEKTCLTPFIESKIGFEPKQIRETFINVGYKPDLFGNIIKRPVNTSLLRGIDKTDYFNSSIGTRKALIINYKNVKKSGYLTKKLLLLTADLIFNNEKDCHSKHYLSVKISNDDIFKRFLGRNYLDEKTNKLKVLGKTDTNLIGEIVKFRSPITCASKEGICNTCYGEKLHEINKDLRPGLLATLLLTNQFTQNLLSSKHLLKVDTDEIDLSMFEEYFVFSENYLIPKNINFTIMINKADLRFTSNNTTYTQKIHIVKSNKKIIELESKVKLFLTETLLDKIYSSIDSMVKIHSSNLQNECFEIIVENKEFSKSLEKINEVLETKNHLIDSQNYNKVYNYFLSLLNINKISINSCHTELIFRRMIRNEKNEVPDFSKKELEAYTLLRISSAIFKSNSVSLSLSFERVKLQLKTLAFYNYNKESLLDIFFKTEI